MAMPALWGRKNAYNVIKVWWTLRELGLDFRHHDVGSEPGDLETEEFLQMNPHARVPVLVDDDAIIWESNSIIRYLAAVYGSQTLWAESPYLRSRYERWMDWELCKLQPAFIELFWGFYRTPEARRNTDLIERAGQAMQAQLRQLDRQLDETDWLAGANFSAADIVCGVCLYRYQTMGYPVSLPAAVERWYRRLCEREAYRETVMQPYEELYARVDY